MLTLSLTRSEIAVKSGNRLFFSNFGRFFILFFFGDLGYNCYDYD